MDKIKKLFKKLSVTDRIALAEALELLIVNNLAGLDIKKLAGGNLCRLRVGNFRIIFKRRNAENIVYEIRRRDENTYQGLA
ncbi:MAG: hypothetical protein A2538_04070 [Candidatus Magasanikbacteria bacterium RIFOXYD2_FULL_41_14]|uniref:Plasmid stabilization protein n=1 Tax=Candidatus Magasanikbacteria bacterium RIFOXYD2_FULL_41_14 TaxID=1798709 RepID=A0A1F6PFY5_9BACT|nr:MAG: hypothetical protein A2538_04070 [Candidatus Magasanikbacteria bacterium RIFOXYD2_FULL_41_14]